MKTNLMVTNQTVLGQKSSVLCENRGNLPVILVISNHPAPYRDPTFAAVHLRRRVKIIVLNISSYASNHPYWELTAPRYPHIDLQCETDPIRQIFMTIQVLRRLRPDVVLVPGIKLPACVVAILSSIAMGMPFIYSADTVCFLRRVGLIGWAKDKVLKMVLRRAGAAWVPGALSRKFMITQGIDADRIFEGCYCLDAVSLSDRLKKARGCREQTRLALGIDPKKYAFLFVGAMIQQRRVSILIDVFKSLFRTQPEAVLVLVGSGPERDRVAELATGLGAVKLLGALPFNRLPDYYAACDAYVHPGSEPYSLALNQAALSGLPVVVTDKVGAVADCVRHKHTGLVIREGNREDLEFAMSWLITHRSEGRLFGEHGREIANRRTIDWAAEQLEYAIIAASHPKNPLH